MTPGALFDFILLGALWGSSFLFMRIAVVDMGPLQVAAVRVAIAAAFLLPLLLWRGLLAHLLARWRALFVIGLFNSGLPFALFAFSLLSITTGLSAILNATVPMFGALVAWIWLSDRLNASRVAGLAVGFVGVGLLAADKAAVRAEASSMDAALAILACLGAAVSYAVGASAAKRYLAGVPPLVTAAGSQLGATLWLAVPGAMMWPAQPVPTSAWLAVLAVGVLCTGLAYILYFRLIESVGPSRTLSVTFLIPAFAIVYGVVFLQEAVTPWMLMCGVVVACGTALAIGLVRLPRLRAPRR